MDKKDVKLRCDICGEEKFLEDLFRCYICRSICCNDHVDHDYAICPRCDEDE